jgi:hypothetical protein
MFDTFLRRFLSETSRQGQRRQSAREKKPARRRSARLLLETLEDRLAPSTVTLPGDHGPGTLRDAIKNAAPGETITFASSVHSITLTSGELTIS